MRWILCALLLSVPSLAFAAPQIGNVLPAQTTFTSSKVVQIGVSSIQGTLNVSVSVNGGTPFVAVPDENLEGVWTVLDLGLVTQDPLVVGNTVLHIVATDDDGTSTLDRTYTFDDQKPVSDMVIVDPPVDHDTLEFTTGLPFVRITGTIPANSDNDPLFRKVIRVRGFDVTPNGTDSYTNQRIDLTPGVNRIFAPIDRAGNVPARSFTITRTVVCQDPNFPIDTNTGGTLTYNVDRFDDLPDPLPNDDNCDVRPDLRDDENAVDPTGLKKCTLRAAIQSANHHPGDDVIVLPRGSFVLRREGVAGDAEADASGDLDVTDDLRIIGAARDISIIDARRLRDRALDVRPGKTLQLVRLTVLGGHTPKPVDASLAEGGGCVRSQGRLQGNNLAFLSCKSDGDGGAISIEPPEDALAPNGGALTCTIVARSQARKDGGAIAVTGAPFSLRNSTVSLNSAGLRGGAISMVGEDALTLALSNVTISMNRARRAGGALDIGAGVTATINNATFTGNFAQVDAAFSSIDGGQVVLSNSIVGERNRACDPNAAPPLTSMGGNVERGATCLVTPDPTDQKNVDPKLDRLRTNGGPPSHLLKLGSPAIDRAGTGPTKCEPLDVRDVERGDWPTSPNAPGSDTSSPKFCDAGALELFVTPLP